MFVCIISYCECSEAGTVFTDNELSVNQAQSACEQEVANTAAVHWSSSLTIQYSVSHSAYLFVSTVTVN